MNFHEALNFDKKKQDYFHGCHGMPLWILVIGLMSHLLLTCNSALNFVLYSVVSEGFRLGKNLVFRESNQTFFKFYPM